jgi:hypothetical protein
VYLNGVLKLSKAGGRGKTAGADNIRQAPPGKRRRPGATRVQVGNPS